jgi:GntR family transcriptional regulator, transcriptional repressor for pyruvate dehydrogenase complex
VLLLCFFNPGRFIAIKKSTKSVRALRASSKGVIPVERTTLSAAAFDQLISHVVRGRWKAGDRIPPERDLCQQLGIARTSLREALKAMELVGMVDSRVGDGTFVCPRSEFLSRPLLWAFTGTDDAEFQEIMEARIIIEENLAGLAAQRASKQEIKVIGDAMQMMRDSIARGEPILEADMAFHLTIAHASHNNVLAKSVQLLRNVMRQWLFYKVQIPDVAPRILKRHLAIYRAIAQQRPVAARREMRLHLEEAMVMVESVIKQRQSGRRKHL